MNYEWISIILTLYINNFSFARKNTKIVFFIQFLCEKCVLKGWKLPMPTHKHRAGFSQSRPFLQDG